MNTQKHRFRCISCGSEYPPDELVYTCKFCGGLIDVVYDFSRFDVRAFLSALERRSRTIWRYLELLPINDPSSIVTLHEGYTPLYRSIRLSTELKMMQLFMKYEGANPTGSFKDRGMSVGVTDAFSHGSKACVCASTGNTSASMSAYAVRAGLMPLVILPRGNVAIGKVAQAIAYGATIMFIDGSFDDALAVVKEIVRQLPICLLNSINPMRHEGQKTLAFELYEQLQHEVPDAVVVPVGNAGNISAIWKGFTTLQELGMTDRLPRMMGVQAEGAAPIVSALESGGEMTPVQSPKTIATAIRIGNPANWAKAVVAIKNSGGGAISVSDEEILEAQKDLAGREGLFVEPASAASLAGLRRFMENGLIVNDERTVLILTGCGLKDPEVVEEHYRRPIELKNDPSMVVERVRQLMQQETRTRSPLISIEPI